MGNYKKTVKNDLEALRRSDKTLKDIYNIMFSHRGDFAYERLVDYEIDAVTYEELDSEVRDFAAYLSHTYPAAAGGYIGIDLSNGPNFIVAFWGALMSGCRPYLVNSFYPSELKTRLLKRLGAELVITSADCYPDFTVVDIDGYGKGCPRAPEGLWQDEFALSSTMTGLEAKICLFDGEAVASQILNTRDILRANNWLIKDYHGRIKVAMILPLFHIFGIMAGYFWFAFFGGTMVFQRDNSPDTIRGTINRHKVTHIFAPPIFFHKLHKGIMNGVSQERADRKKKFQRGLKLAFALQNIFPSLGLSVSRRLFREVIAASLGVSPRAMISGGAHIDGEALRVINCIGYPLFNGYGTTETAISGVNIEKRIAPRTDGSIGAPFKGISYTCGEDGALSVAGASLCKRIITLQGEESGFGGANIETNDLLEIIKGRYFIIGRKSDLYIGENGENISPDIIQNALKVKNANGFCVLEIDGKLALVLEYGEKMPSGIIADEIGRIKKALAGIAYGLHISDIFVTRQPITNLHEIKVSREALKRRIDNGEILLKGCNDIDDGGVKQGECEDDALMSSIKEVFGHVMGMKAEIQPDTDFFLDLGGTSLDYMTMVCEFEAMFNIQINLENNQNLRTPECFYKHIKDVLL